MSLKDDQETGETATEQDTSSAAVIIIQ